MPVTNVTHDLDNRSLTLVADFAAPLERIWQIYADPRQLEQVWGPPGYPATFVDHEMRPGGRMNYYMTSPEGEKFYGYWEIDAVEQPNSFSFRDGFALDDSFARNEELPEAQNTCTFAAHDGGTRMTWVGIYASAEALQQVLDMGMIEGATAAVNQIDDLIAA